MPHLYFHVLLLQLELTSIWRTLITSCILYLRGRGFLGRTSSSISSFATDSMPSSIISSSALASSVFASMSSSV